MQWGLWEIGDERSAQELPQEAAAGAGRRGARPHRLRDDPKQARSAGSKWPGSDLCFFTCTDVVCLVTDREIINLQAYAELLEENGIRIPAWFSFTSKDGVNAASGDPITECAAVADSCPRVAAVGVNCAAPRLIHGLILSIKKVIIILSGSVALSTQTLSETRQFHLFPGDAQANRRVSEQREDVHRRDERMGGALLPYQLIVSYLCLFLR